MSQSSATLRLALHEWSRRDFALALAILVVTLLTYLPVMDAGLIWDDDYYLLDNLHMSSLEGLRRVWLVIGSTSQYYPMIHTSFWFEYQLWGLDPAGYHVDNVVLHAFNAILFWRMLRRLDVPGAWLAGAIFALHPVQVESVAWISERKNLLSTFFYLAAMHTYFRYESPEQVAGKKQYDLRWYGAAFGLFLCALTSKTVTFSLPAAIALIIWWKRGRLQFDSLRPLAPFIVAGGAFGYLTAWMEKTFVGAAGHEWSLSAVERLLIAGRAPWFYAGKLLWPVDLAFSYPRWELDSSAAWQFAFPIAALALVVAAWGARERIGRGPLVALLYFGGTLFPALGFFDLYPFVFSFVADHFQYLASLGPIALFAAATTKLLERVPFPGAQATSAILLLLALGGASWNYSHVFHSQETLWSDVVAKNPESTLAHNNLGVVYLELGRFEGAEFHARKVLSLNPTHRDGHFNLAIVLSKRSDEARAIRHYRLQIEQDPDHLGAHENLAGLLLKRGLRREAAAELAEVLRITPDNYVIRSRLRSLQASLERE